MLYPWPFKLNATCHIEIVKRLSKNIIDQPFISLHFQCFIASLLTNFRTIKAYSAHKSNNDLLTILSDTVNLNIKLFLSTFHKKAKSGKLHLLRITTSIVMMRLLTLIMLRVRFSFLKNPPSQSNKNGGIMNHSIIRGLHLWRATFSTIPIILNQFPSNRRSKDQEWVQHHSSSFWRRC